MKFIYWISLCFYFFVSSCCTNPTEWRSLRAPDTVSVSIKGEPPSVHISWEKIVSDVEEDPVLGYKVKVTEVKGIKKIVSKYDEVSNKLISEEVVEYPPINSRVPTEGNLTELVSPAVDHPTVTYAAGFRTR